jgi:membrane protease YdiL (CAAX protease family)
LDKENFNNYENINFSREMSEIWIWHIYLAASVIIGVSILYFTRKLHSLEKYSHLKALFIVLIFWIARTFAAYAWMASGAIVNTGYIVLYTVAFSFDFMLLMSNVILLLSILLILSFVKLEKIKWGELGWNGKALLRNIGIGVLVGFLISIFNLPIAITHTSIKQLILSASFGFLAGAWQEENIFRGYLLNSFTKKMKEKNANALQALIYSISHIGFYVPNQNILLFTFFVFLAFSFVIGFILGYVKLKLNNIIPSFVASGIFNTISFGISYI